MWVQFGGRFISTRAAVRSFGSKPLWKVDLMAHHFDLWIRWTKESTNGCGCTENFKSTTNHINCSSSP
jgi:hypothetical protein